MPISHDRLLGRRRRAVPRARLALVLLSIGLQQSGCNDSSGHQTQSVDMAHDGEINGADARVVQEQWDGARDTAVTTPGDSGQHQTRFVMPIHPDDRDQIHAGLVIGVDHDAMSGNAIECRNYDGRGFPACYDDHEGTDFMVWGGFETTDQRDVRVVAAAPGRVTRTESDQYDRCHGDLNALEVDCDGHPMRANRVHVRHPDGVESRYLHLKRSSVLVEVGDEVQCGQVIAMVGSSGRSVAPHLHFEVRSTSDELIDPFEGSLSQASSYWIEQSSNDTLPGGACGR